MGSNLWKRIDTMPGNLAHLLPRIEQGALWSVLLVVVNSRHN